TPLVFSSSQLFRPMSIALMSGLMVSTLLTLVVIPTVYYVVESKLEKRKVIKVNKSFSHSTN
ncbi:MAG: hypothetical protein K0Q65_528, partial [Clostridia bacterium]|nr:hypothetical protein [Clostridia bacterium]